MNEELARTDDGWETLWVEARPAGTNVRVDACVRFKHGGRALRYDWAEYLRVEDGRVVRRIIGCGGAVSD